MKFIYDNKELTITQSDLTESEKLTFNSLVRLGDSEDLALWTIEHQERMKPDNYDAYAEAYHY